MGSFFLIIMFCSAIHVYTDRFTDMGIIAIRPPWLRCEFLAELPLVFIFWSYTKVLDSSIWASIQGSLQSQYLFPELEATFSRKSCWGYIAMQQNVCSTASAFPVSKLRCSQVLLYYVTCMRVEDDFLKGPSYNWCNIYSTIVTFLFRHLNFWQGINVGSLPRPRPGMRF